MLNLEKNWRLLEMLVDIKQTELDKAEEILFTKLFGSTSLDSKTQWFLNFFNINVNETIQNFESFMKPLMLDNGLVNASMLRNLLKDSHPTSDFRLADIVNDISNTILSLTGRIK